MRENISKFIILLLGLSSVIFFSTNVSYGAEYYTKVLRSDGEYLENNDQVGYAWKDLHIYVKGKKVQVIFRLKVWNNIRTPITQIFVCVRNKVYGCVFNRVPSHISHEKFVNVGVEFDAYYPSKNMSHNVYIVLTQAPNERIAKDHIEIEDGGWKSKVGYISTI